MNGNKTAVLDSNILIYLSKGQLDFGTISEHYSHLHISVVTFMEVLGFEFANPLEEVLLKNLIKLFDVIHTDLEIAKLVIEYRKSKKIKIPDAIILATASRLNADLITLNDKDFINMDSKIMLIKPSLD